MKPTLPLLLLLFGVLSWTGCKSDDPATLTTLNYDGPNASAPQLPPGRNLFAAYFPPAETQPYVGRTLDRITFYLTQVPLATTVLVFGEGPDNRTPGPELYRRDITGRVNTTEWIEDRLIPGIEITGEGIWLAVEVELPDGQPFSVGCDAGRSYDPNGDLLLLSTATQWASFNDITGETVNWNIRGVLAEE
ncbi:hypothetical protein GGR26_003552 [Lewinella marina]|uniref:Lipoprotein n=1 Tax=Neolewinella marina TaxID=438751 RepID=A0A2G0CBC9_9BACT|nr:hypothetical protein [Neolewinella marina]NJB87766.1 hypothetical protein [Neolewinella marina]PHK97237.1 hypothetical protein CGL56_16790 [Neolewinella marina]